MLTGIARNIRYASTFTNGLFEMTSVTFSSPIQGGARGTTAAVTGPCIGPTQTELQTYYNSNDTTLANLLSIGTYFQVPYQGYQRFIIPISGLYTITAQGGGAGSNTPGVGGTQYGCRLTGTFTFSAGDAIWIAVGHAGSTGHSDTSDQNSPGGGGATCVAYSPVATATTNINSVSDCLIMAAGGTAPCEPLRTVTLNQSVATNGTIGSGYSSQFLGLLYNGSYGGFGGFYGYGGFGGGTGSDDNVGGAGGYDGFFVNGANSFINATATSVTRQNNGDNRWPNAGYVTITKL